MLGIMEPPLHVLLKAAEEQRRSSEIYNLGTYYYLLRYCYRSVIIHLLFVLLSALPSLEKG